MTNTSLTPHQRMAALIEAQMSRPDLTAEDVLQLTIARRLNNLSDHALAQALGGSETPLNFWNRR